MKNIRYFKTSQELRDYIYSEVITTPELQKHPFYQKLIEFIIYERAPIFFEPNEEYEWSHFTQYFNFCVIRLYDNSTLKSLYNTHDFIHMLFHYPLQPHKNFFENFLHTNTYNEYAASNDTEILTYYRIPGLREKTFQMPILYDHLIKQHPLAPSTQELVSIRKKCVLNGYIMINGKKIADQSIHFLQQFKYTNVERCKLWYDNFPQIDYPGTSKTLSRYDYQSQLMNYAINTSEKKYQKSLLHNVRIGLQLLGHKILPKHFDEIDDYIPLLENKIFMKQAAEGFHKLYTKLKVKAKISCDHK